MSVRAPAEKNFRRPKVKPGRRKVARRLSWRTGAWCAAVFLGVIGLYFATDAVVSASALQVRRISVRGNVRLSSGEVQALMDGLKGSSILVADLNAYRSRVMESPWVAEVALRRVLPSTVEVFVSERRPVGLCRIGTQLYLLDRAGVIIDEFGPGYAEFDLPIIDGVVRTPSPGAPSIDERRTELAARVIDSVAPHKTLMARLSQIDVRDIHDAVVLLDGDPTLLHVGTERFAERLQTYVEVAGTLREQFAEMDYVDLRFEDRIYARPAGSPAVQVAKSPPAKR
jgi:cell division septal protein FtsQ